VSWHSSLFAGFSLAADDPPLLHAMLHQFDQEIKCNGK
jgi:hypothetical protein